MLWVVLAPIYDFQDVEPDEIAEITTTLLNDGVELCSTVMRSVELKLHLGGIGDRSYAYGVASALKWSRPFLVAEVRGSWLHVTGVGQ